MANPYANTANPQSLLPMTAGNVAVVAPDFSLTHITPTQLKQNMAIAVADIIDFASATSSFLTSASMASYALASSLSGYVTTSALTSVLTGYMTITAANSAFATAAQGAKADTALQSIPQIAYSSLSGLPTIPTILPRSFLPPATRAIVTSATDPGWTFSTTRDTFVTYSPTVTTTASIGGDSAGSVVLEIAPPGATLATDWIEKARMGNGQSVSLAVALKSVQVISSPLKTIVPATYSVRLRSISTGTGANAPTYVLNSVQEVLL